MRQTAKRPPRLVSNAEFEAAWSDSDNQGILKAITGKFWKSLDEDERGSLAMQSLWEALRGHRDDMGQKFTTSLHFFASRRCLDACRRKRAGIGKITRRDLSAIVAVTSDDEAENQENDRVEQIKAYFDRLTPMDRDLLKLKLLDGLSYEEAGARHGIKGETAHRHIVKASKYLRVVCEDADLGF